MERDMHIMLGFGRAGASSYEEMYLDCALRRLEGLGLEVHVSDPACWDRHFDYSKYSVVALIASCNPVKDPEHLLGLLAKGSIGFIVFGAWNATSTLAYMGLLKDDRVKVKHQSAVQVHRTADDHYITSFLQPTRAYNLGTKYVSCVLHPGHHTSTLLHVDGDAALLVHTKMRACVSHWTGDPSQHDQETADSIELTRRCIVWAAGLDKKTAPTPTLPQRAAPSLTVEQSTRPSRPPQPPASNLYSGVPPTPFAALLNDLWQLIDNEELADVVFIFRDRRLYANQAILAIRCPFLRAWMERERGSSSRNPGAMLEILVGDEICSQAFHVVLLFLYTTSIPPDLPPTTLLNVLVTAQDCGLEDLKRTCEDLILGSVEATNAVSLLIAAHQLQQTDIKEMTMDYISRHLSEVKATGTVDLLKAYPDLMLELLKI
eukprot:GGOE01001538.1.p1 GENE.GGOE01001538.1~~GGOE01001538.1.p1  ORF type:complete len:432 (+),score=87.58 GGOE01001538.1:36-1331(+)